ncbi:hypothetical protein D3C81_1354780 [compost metagenome]
MRCIEVNLGRPGGSSGRLVCRKSRYSVLPGVITTSWPCVAASMPPSMPRQDITVACGGRPPSMISSQPISLRSCASRYVSRRLSMCDCNASSSFKPSSRIWACTCGESCHWYFTASSPPMWMYLPGNISMTSARMFSRNCSVSSRGLNRYGFTPQLADGCVGPSTTPCSGYAATAACAWPGTSTSGTTVM